MVHILPGRPAGKPDQMSPLRAAVPIDGPFRTADELELATLSWVHWFNGNRLHSSINYLTPIEKENTYYREMTSQSQPALGNFALH